MNHQAIIARVFTRAHPNADRLQLGTVLGYQVIVGLDVQDGELGIFFPEGLQLSAEYAQANDLIRRKDEQGRPAGGMFDENRRVRCQKFRGEKSDGYWSKLSSLDFIDSLHVGLAEGDQLDSYQDVPLCSKYITPATRQAGGRHNSARSETPMFRRHPDTEQLRINLYAIKERDRIILTLKLHGTSQRVGHVLDNMKLPWWKRVVNRLAPVFPIRAWTYLIGSRNVILTGKSGYHGIHFRERAAQVFFGKLHKGETAYFEVVGYETSGVPVMSRHQAKDKNIREQYGDQITYSYGCEDGQLDVYVYRITMSNEDGVTVELPWDAVKERCQELGVKHVPELNRPFHYCGDPDKLKEFVETFVEGSDPIDPSHPREGVCVRVESGLQPRIFKAKGWLFNYLEGNLRDRPDFIDAEEAA